ncbi:MAG TPA: AmmeMemoRadiSam system protein B [Planctomycetes bacterium]|nr:AmmeMemoRadiSam system protein B [Planctomycetota bacterium]
MSERGPVPALPVPALPTRVARFAGSWYPGTATALGAAVEEASGPEVARERATALILPHAGWRYSLRIAAPAVARVEVPERVVFLCPNHRVPPPVVAAWPEGSWQTPLGPVPVDAELTQRLLDACPRVSAGTEAHLEEHAIEVLLPLLQRAQPQLKIVAVVVAEPSYEGLAEIGRGLAEAVRGLGGAAGEVLIVASSDMSHFLSAPEARRRDERALERLLAFDAEGLLERCVSEQISMCGVRPTVVALEAARALGATQVELVDYGHSGEVSGDESSVVGYASAIVR